MSPHSHYYSFHYETLHQSFAFTVITRCGEMESPDPLTIVMKRVVIRGCFLCLSVLYRRWWRHPSLALRRFQNVSLLPTFRRRWPRVGSFQRTFKTGNGEKYLWQSVCGSLRGWDCCENISIGKIHDRQKVAVFFFIIFEFFFQPACFSEGSWKERMRS